MKIFISHSTDFDYKNDLYLPLRNSSLNKKYNFFLPHEKKLTNIKEMIQNSDLIIAEASYPFAGQGIELNWAYEARIPIICFYKISAKISSYLKRVTEKFIEYEDSDDFLQKLNILLIELQQ
jgi:hypothetical protein